MTSLGSDPYYNSQSIPPSNEIRIEEQSASSPKNRITIQDVNEAVTHADGTSTFPSQTAQRFGMSKVPKNAIVMEADDEQAESLGMHPSKVHSKNIGVDVGGKDLGVDLGGKDLGVDLDDPGPKDAIWVDEHSWVKFHPGKTKSEDKWEVRVKLTHPKTGEEKEVFLHVKSYRDLGGTKEQGLKIAIATIFKMKEFSRIFNDPQKWNDMLSQGVRFNITNEGGGSFGFYHNTGNDLRENVRDLILGELRLVGNNSDGADLEGAYRFHQHNFINEDVMLGLTDQICEQQGIPSSELGISKDSKGNFSSSLSLPEIAEKLRELKNRDGENGAKAEQLIRSIDFNLNASGHYIGDDDSRFYKLSWEGRRDPDLFLDSLKKYSWDPKKTLIKERPSKKTLWPINYFKQPQTGCLIDHIMQNVKREQDKIDKRKEEDAKNKPTNENDESSKVDIQKRPPETTGVKMNITKKTPEATKMEIQRRRPPQEIHMKSNSLHGGYDPRQEQLLKETEEED